LKLCLVLYLKMFLSQQRYHRGECSSYNITAVTTIIMKGYKFTQNTLLWGWKQNYTPYLFAILCNDRKLNGRMTELL